LKIIIIIKIKKEKEKRSPKGICVAHVVILGPPFRPKQVNVQISVKEADDNQIVVNVKIPVKVIDTGQSC